MLLGLPIEDKAVNGRVNKDNTICEELMGASLCEDISRGQGINLKYIKQYYSILTLTEDSMSIKKT